MTMSPFQILLTGVLAVCCGVSLEAAAQERLPSIVLMYVDNLGVARLDAEYQNWLVDTQRDASPPAPRPPR